LAREGACSPQAETGALPISGNIVTLSVDRERRDAIQRHHTVTHLLHWALHEVVSRDASQKGSYVGPDKLTFDFSSAPLTKQQVRDVENLVNEKIKENAPVSWTEISFAEAKQRKDIIQFFGEKYGDTVRVLQVGGAPHALNGYSMELCGGTHVRSTAEIGPFRIVREEAIAAGIRRIEAVAGDAARSWATQEAARQQEKFEALTRKKPDIAPLQAFENDATTSEMLQQIDARAAHLEKVEVEVRDWEKQSAKTAEAELRSRAAQIANQLAASHAGKNLCVAEVQNGDGKLLQAVADALKSKFNGPIFLVGATNGSVALVASVPKEMSARLQANKLIQQIASLLLLLRAEIPAGWRRSDSPIGRIGEGHRDILRRRSRINQETCRPCGTRRLGRRNGLRSWVVAINDNGVLPQQVAFPGLVYVACYGAPRLYLKCPEIALPQFSQPVSPMTKRSAGARMDQRFTFESHAFNSDGVENGYVCTTILVDFFAAENVLRLSPS